MQVRQERALDRTGAYNQVKLRHWH